MTKNWFAMQLCMQVLQIRGLVWTRDVEMTNWFGVCIFWFAIGSRISNHANHGEPNLPPSWSRSQASTGRPGPEGRAQCLFDPLVQRSESCSLSPGGGRPPLCSELRDSDGQKAPLAACARHETSNEQWWRSKSSALRLRASRVGPAVQIRIHQFQVGCGKALTWFGGPGPPAGRAFPRLNPGWSDSERRSNSTCQRQSRCQPRRLGAWREDSARGRTTQNSKTIIRVLTRTWRLVTPTARSSLRSRARSGRRGASRI